MCYSTYGLVFLLSSMYTMSITMQLSTECDHVYQLVRWISCLGVWAVLHVKTVCSVQRVLASYPGHCCGGEKDNFATPTMAWDKAKHAYMYIRPSACPPLIFYLLWSEFCWHMKLWNIVTAYAYVCIMKIGGGGSYSATVWIPNS